LIANGLSAEQRRAAEEGLTEDEPAIFDLLKKDNLTKAELELARIGPPVGPLERWTEKEQTQAEVETFILDRIYESLPTPPFDASELGKIAKLAYQHIWQQSAAGEFSSSATA